MLDTEYRDGNFLADCILLLIGPGSSLVASREVIGLGIGWGSPSVELVRNAPEDTRRIGKQVGRMIVQLNNAIGHEAADLSLSPRE